LENGAENPASLRENRVETDPVFSSIDTYRRKMERGKEPMNFPREEYEGPKTPSTAKKPASKKKNATPQPATPSTKTQKLAGKTPSPKVKKPTSPVVKASTVVPATPARGARKDGGLVCTLLSVLLVLIFVGVVTYGWCTEEFTLSGLYGEMKNTVDWEGMYLKTKHVKGNVFGYVLRLIKKDEL